MTAHDDGGVEDWSEQFTNGSAERTEQVRELESPNARKLLQAWKAKESSQPENRGRWPPPNSKPSLLREGSPPVAPPVATPVMTGSEAIRSGKHDVPDAFVIADEGANPGHQFCRTH